MLLGADFQFDLFPKWKRGDADLACARLLLSPRFLQPSLGCVETGGSGCLPA
jgi:hypothetical protein